MFRLVLTAYLSLAVAFGPSLCCCTSLAVLSGVASMVTGGDDPVHHCPYHAALARAKSSADQPAHPQQDDSRKCPCREGRPALVLASVEKNTDALTRLDVGSFFIVDALPLVGESLCGRASFAPYEDPPV